MQISIGDTPVQVTRWTVLIGLIAVGLVAYGGYDYAQQSEAVDDAVAVEATVHNTSLTEDISRGSTSYDVSVEYTYEYQGTNYTSDELYPGAKSYDTESAAEDELESYSPGDTVTAYVDPAAPGDGFLKKQTTQGPLWLIGGGVVLFVLRIVRDTGVQDIDETELSDTEPTRYDTLFGLDRDTIHHWSTRSIAISAVVGVISILGILGFVAAKFIAQGSTYAPGTVSLAHPLGLMLLCTGVGAFGLVVSLFGYSLWSVTEYRRLRTQLEQPRPPSPFKHPTRLEAIVTTDEDDLDDYRTHVRRMVFVLAVLLVCLVLVFSVVLF